ncbi:hypothetical protein [[Clostridium] fimetarium]|uniref:YokE-like PH domain-containing protein n=1 Tax=[Clostridium] fimetarium TaxID=99656 RepID=A0A1I0N5J1_9FIRM|nr:hypothetical protein [[Clostridium] fimetarium]SEV96349.1 hypothetical protein SAMN05421659_102391 [[Clostridium] fimetarium]
MKNIIGSKEMIEILSRFLIEGEQLSYPIECNISKIGNKTLKAEAFVGLTEKDLLVSISFFDIQKQYKIVRFPFNNIENVSVKKSLILKCYIVTITFDEKIKDNIIVIKMSEKVKGDFKNQSENIRGLLDRISKYSK